MEKRYVVQLTLEQRSDLQGRFRCALTLRQRNRIQVLLRSADGDTDADIADDLGICADTVANVRKRFATDGLEASLGEKPRCGVPPKLDGKAQAVLIGLACSPAPEGRVCWTGHLLANRMVEMKVVESVSTATISRVLKKTRSSRGRSSRGVCPKV